MRGELGTIRTELGRFGRQVSSCALEHLLPELPAGQSWLFIEISGDDPAEVADRARRVSRLGVAVSARVLTDAREASAFWKIREDGGGLARRTPDNTPAHSGWEGSAVPPEKLGAYVRDFDALILEHGLTGFPVGHFGDGCLQVRLDFPFGRGTDRFRAFMAAAAQLVTGMAARFRASTVTVEWPRRAH